jgi:hypothetical protein
MPIINHDDPDDIVHEQVEQDEDLSQAMQDCIAWLDDPSSDQSSPVWGEGVM